MLEPARTPSPPPAPSPQDFAEPMDLSEKPGPGAQGGAKGGVPTAGQTPMKQNHVGTVILSGVPIVSLVIEAKERLCLAQISNTLLKEFSYNEIHNRRVALGITCVQCTPVQLEILRRAGAMPISSRRCGMITKREAERLVKSFLEEHTPPGLPENFAFNVKHTCGWGCKGSFVPARYNSSRAKCIRCSYCNMFFSPNKFIFHFHRIPEAKYRHPDAANFNSWRRHLHLDYQDPAEELVHAWEDVKAMFNGGSRKRLVTPSSKSPSNPHSSDGGPSKKTRTDLVDQVSLPKVGEAGLRFNMMSTASSQMPALMGQGPNPYSSFPAAMMHPESIFNQAAENQKMNMNNLWKAKANPYYHPLGLFWAKNLGIYPPHGAGPFGGGAGVQGEEALARELMMRGKLPPRAAAPALPPEELMKDAVKELPMPWKHMSAFRPVGGYTRAQNISPTGLGYVPVLGVDDSSSGRVSNPALSPEQAVSDPEDGLDDPENDINVTDVLDTDVNRNDIENKIAENAKVDVEMVRDAQTTEITEVSRSRSPSHEEKDDLKKALFSPAADNEEISDKFSESNSGQVDNRVPTNILSMSKEELQRELLKMMSGKPETGRSESQGARLSSESKCT